MCVKGSNCWWECETKQLLMSDSVQNYRVSVFLPSLALWQRGHRAPRSGKTWDCSASACPLYSVQFLKCQRLALPVPWKGEGGIVRVLWFQRCSRVCWPFRVWNGNTWKGYMNFEQRRKLRTQRDITDALSVLDHHSSLADEAQEDFCLTAGFFGKAEQTDSRAREE